MLIAHDEIENFMMPMTMIFKIKEEIQLNEFSINDSVHFKLYINHDTNPIKSYAYDFVKKGKSKVQINEDEFWSEDDEQYLPKMPGETIDDASFLDLNSKKYSISKTDSTYRIISFVFSRCPMPNMCPALINKNINLANYFNNIKNVEFIILSFDYIYDTPSKLNDIYNYTQSSYSNIKILSSYQSFEDLMTFSRQLGFSFWGITDNDKQKIGHTMSTVLLSPDMKIISRYDGLDWDWNTLKQDLKGILLTKGIEMNPNQF